MSSFECQDRSPCCLEKVLARETPSSLPMSAALMPLRLGSLAAAASTMGCCRSSQPASVTVPAPAAKTAVARSGQVDTGVAIAGCPGDGADPEPER